MRPNRVSVYQELARIVGGGVKWCAPLRQYSRWDIGGLADIIVEPRTLVEIQAVLARLHESGVPRVIIGGGTNLLFDDEGFRGVVVRVGSALSRFEASASGLVTAEAGLWVPAFVRRVIRANLAGCVHAIGIPGRLGGLVVMNGGTNRRGIGEHLVDVTVVDRDGQARVLTKEQCGFSYRFSSLQSMGALVVSARFSFVKQNPAELRREALSILQQRRRKFPLKQPSCGSVFLSTSEIHDAVGPPGRVIEQAGLKGVRVGGAMVSPRHANFIVNVGGARSAEVLALIRTIRNDVHAQTGYWLTCEVQHVSPDGRIRPAHESADELGDRFARSHTRMS